MDFNGNVSEGVSQNIDVESVCAVSGSFANLSVGLCDGSQTTIEYKLPTARPSESYNNAVIVNQGGIISISNPGAFFPWGLSPNLFFIIPIPVGHYAINDLLLYITNARNAQSLVEGQTNICNLTVIGGYVQATVSAGTSLSYRITTASVSIILGNTTDSGTIPTGTPYTFPSLPTYSAGGGASWSNYKFDATGAVFQGDLTVTGTLSAQTVVADLNVEDALISLNLNAPGDNFTSGVILNSVNNTKFSGLVKADSGSDFYLFANSSTMPTPNGWVPQSNANLFLAGLTADALETGGYTFPLSDGTINQVLATDGAGGLSFVNPSTDRLISPDTLSKLLITDLKLEYDVSAVTRIIADGTQTRLFSPDALKSIDVQNSATNISDAGGVRLLVSSTNSDLFSPNKLTSLGMIDGSLALAVSTVPRLELSAGSSRLRSADTSSVLELLDNAIITRSDGFDRLAILQTVTNINDPSGNTAVAIYASQTQIRAGLSGANYLGLNLTTVGPSVISPDQLTNFSVSNNTAILAKSGASRIFCDNVTTGIYSPNNSHSVSCDDARVFLDGKTIIKDDNYVQLGTSTGVNRKGFTIKFIANETFIRGSCLKIVNIAGVARVTQVLAADPDSTIVVGVADTPGVLNGEVDVVVGGIAFASVENGITITCGNPVEKSDTVNGRVWSVVASPGTFGTALATVTGNLDGSNLVPVLYKLSESI